MVEDDLSSVIGIRTRQRGRRILLALAAAEVGLGGFLTDLDDRPTIARVRVKGMERVFPSPKRIARVRTERSSLKRPSISSTASLLCRKTSRHIVGSDAAMRVKSRKPPAENLVTSDCVTSPRCAAVPTML